MVPGLHKRYSVMYSKKVPSCAAYCKNRLHTILNKVFFNWKYKKVLHCFSFPSPWQWILFSLNIGCQEGVSIAFITVYTFFLTLFPSAILDSFAIMIEYVNIVLYRSSANTLYHVQLCLNSKGIHAYFRRFLNFTLFYTFFHWSARYLLACWHTEIDIYVCIMVL